MLSRSTLLHLRIPFSVFLMPVFLFAFSQVPQASWANVALVFVAVHLFLYPASNGFNSYYDKDEDSIGGLETPPPVTHDLLWVSLAFDAAALVLGLFAGVKFAALLLVYGLVSKAYSHPKIRLKKYPLFGLLTVAVFQGAFTLYMCAVGLSAEDFALINTPKIAHAALLSSLLLLGSYPITQVYQHAEDSRRGDHTLSLLLGIRGTFAWTAVVFTLAMAGFYLFFKAYYSTDIFVIFAVCLLPVLGYFLWWLAKAWQNPAAANFRRTMRLNLLSAVCLSLAFGFLVWLSRI